MNEFHLRQLKYLLNKVDVRLSELTEQVQDITQYIDYLQEEIDVNTNFSWETRMDIQGPQPRCAQLGASDMDSAPKGGR